MLAVRVGAFLAGAVAVVLTVLSAARTVVIPRGTPVVLTRVVFRTSRRVSGFVTRPLRSWDAVEHAMSAYAPVTLLALPVVWLTVVFAAYVAMFSPVPTRSWITAAGCVLDAAAIRASSVDLPRDPEAELCVRTGYLALRRVADYFEIEYDADPRPDDPISVTRQEFDEALERIAAAGVPVVADRDAAWRAYAGWRVNYDRVLLVLAGLTMAPAAPWSSDRSRPYDAPRLLRRPVTRPR